MTDKDDKFESIAVKSTGVSVTTSGIDDVERAYFFPDTAPSETIIEDSTADIDYKIEPQEKKKVIETLNVVKTYLGEVEFGINLVSGLKLRIKREPKKIIKTYRG